ncbi:hypothetical protein Tco_0966423 [Tanacetum coccineum]
MDIEDSYLHDDEKDVTIAITTPILQSRKPDNSLRPCPIPSESESQLEVVEIVVPEVGGIDDDILLTIKDDILQEISSGSLITHSDLSLPDYKAFYVDNDHFKEKCSGSTTTHTNFSQYDSFIFDLLNDQFPPADRSDSRHEEFADELTHIMPLSDLECFHFKNEPNPGDLTSIDLRIHENVSTTDVNVPLENDQSPLFAYVVWIFLAFLTYPVVPPYLLSTGNEDTIFEPPSMFIFFLCGLYSHRSGNS